MEAELTTHLGYEKHDPAGYGSGNSRNGASKNRAVYVALGVTREGRKEVLGLWSSANEGAKFWLQVLTEFKNRGLQDIFIACLDGLKGFPQAIETVSPQTTVHLCIVHLVRGS